MKNIEMPSTPEKSLVERLADKAVELQKTWMWPDNIYRALDALNILDSNERKRFVGEVARELGKRKKTGVKRKRGRLIEDAAQSGAAAYEREEKEREEGE